MSAQWQAVHKRLMRTLPVRTISRWEPERNFRGRPSKDEQERRLKFVRENVGTVHPYDMAAELGIKRSCIYKYIAKVRANKS